MEKITGISAVLIIKNEEAVLEECLRSLDRFEEVVIYFNNSTDASEEIAARFQNTKVTIGPFLGFGPTRNAAAELSSNDWILIIDADETCTAELAESLANFNLEHEAAMTFSRTVQFFMGKKFEAHWHHRIYHRGRCKLEKNVHEEIVPTAGSRDYPRISGAVLHHMPSSLTRQCEKARHYALLAANAGKPRRSAPIAFLLAVHKFINCYFVRLGFLKGKAGLYYAWLKYYAAYVKYTISPTSTGTDIVSQDD